MSRLKTLIAITAFAGIAIAANASGQPLDGPVTVPEGPSRLTAGVLFANATLELQLLMAGFLLILGAAVVLLVIGLVKPGPRARTIIFLKAASGAAAAGGPLGAAYGLMMSFIGVANTNTTNIAVIAPGVAEALGCLALGLLAAMAATIAAGVLEMRGAAKAA